MSSARSHFVFAALLLNGFVYAAPGDTPPTTGGTNSVSNADPAAAKEDNIQVDVKSTFKGRFLVKRIVAPVTMNLEKLQDFPEDPSQKILLDPLPISQVAEFNLRSEVKGHAPFWPWIPAIAEPPFLRMVPPKNVPVASWMFEILNPQGQTVYRQRGTNAVPEELIWEGKDSEKKFAVVNRLYSCQLTLTGPDEKATTVQGKSVILPAIAYGSDDAQTIEVALDRLFAPGKADVSAEGNLMLQKICESLRERGLTKVFIRISDTRADLASRRETVIVGLLQRYLHLSEAQIKHDSNTNTAARGEIVAFWLKTGGAQ